MDEVGPLKLVIVLETLITPIMAPKEITMRMKGHAMWQTILKTSPIIKVANIATNKTILIVGSVEGYVGSN